MSFVSPDAQQEVIGVGSISIMSQADHVIDVMINCRLAGGEQEIHKLGSYGLETASTGYLSKRVQAG